MTARTYRIFNNKGVYQQVIGSYPDQKVVQTFDGFTETLEYIMPRVHLEEGALNFLQFVVGTTVGNEAIAVQTLLNEGESSANSDVYMNRAVRVLENFVNSGKGWRTEEKENA